MLCVCINGTTFEECHSLLSHSAPYADIAELRFDTLQENEQEWSKAEKWVDASPLDCILSIREQQDGGKWTGTQEKKKQIIYSAIEHSVFRWIDLEAEYSNESSHTAPKTNTHSVSAIQAASNSNKTGPRHTLIQEAQELKQRCQSSVEFIVSEHRFIEDREENQHFLAERMLPRIRDLAMQYPFATIKYAIQCHSSHDFLGFLRVCDQLRQDESSYILIPMGNFGLPGRILTHLCATLWTYCSAETAPDPRLGQLTAYTMQKQYRYRQLNLNKKLPPVYAVIGNPVLHSQSPQFFNHHFAKNGQNAVYIPLPIDDLSCLGALVERLHIQGLSVTIPHKHEILPQLAKKEESVEICGACNTVLCKKEGWEGYNTDIFGFLIPLLHHLKYSDSKIKARDFQGALRGKRVTIVGAGGAARAVAYALQLCQAEILVANRSQERAEALAALFPQSIQKICKLEDYNILFQYSDILIQCSGIGMMEGDTPLPNFPFQGNEVVYEIIYTPPVTTFLKDAKKAGAQVIFGAEMFQCQAELQAQLFAGELE